jgi:hypothetical protein
MFIYLYVTTEASDSTHPLSAESSRPVDEQLALQQMQVQEIAEEKQRIQQHDAYLALQAADADAALSAARRAAAAAGAIISSSSSSKSECSERAEKTYHESGVHENKRRVKRKKHTIS